MSRQPPIYHGSLSKINEGFILYRIHSRIRIIFYCLIIGFLLPSISYAQPKIIWSKTYGGTNTDVAESVIETNDGNFVFTNIGNLIKIDNQGNRLWSVGLMGSGKSLVQTADGGYVITGGVSGNLMILKSSSAGEIIWQTVLNNSATEIGLDISINANEEFIVTGKSHPYHSFTQSIVVASFGVNGELLWKKEHGSGIIDIGEDIISLSDGNIVVTGGFVTNPDDATDLLFLKLGAEGDAIWNKTYGGSGGDNGKKIIETKDGGLLAVGNISLFGTKNQDLWIIKTDSNGDSLWTKTYGGPFNESAYSVIQSEIGGYIVVGDSGVGDHHTGGGDLWLLKIDESGNLLWTETFGDGGSDGGRSIFNTKDGGFVVSGFKSDSGNLDAWILRFAPEQAVSVIGFPLNIPIKFKLSQNYPNPFNPLTTIRYALPAAAEVLLAIYNIRGEEVARLVNGEQPAGNYQVSWDASNVASGVYIYRLTTGEFTEIKKMVLLK
ncbi:MAG: T9SS type A sorting domain-containing protein [Candidatus Marinimicrobia bacterium]|nr:T9SS type A sorting domain-containing protein [Candidatus Neomarinimicrobiota bacterium]